MDLLRRRARRAGLLAGRALLEELEEEVAEIAAGGPPEANPSWQEALDLSNQLTVARLLVESALARKESRGAHFRSDFPVRDDDRWLKAIVAYRGDGGELTLETRPVELTRLDTDGAAVACPA